MDKGGLKTILYLAGISLVTAFFYPEISVILIAFIIFLIYFYRDPEREIGEGVVSPADGKIIELSERKIVVFMGPFDCHVNRSPCDGVIERIEYIKGKFFPAFLKKSTENERNRIWIRSDDGTFLIEQIAGIFARRIVCYVSDGERVKKGQRIGMIVFGSRVTLEIPENYKFVVRKGEKVKAGQTVAVKNEETY